MVEGGSVAGVALQDDISSTLGGDGGEGPLITSLITKPYSYKIFILNKHFMFNIYTYSKQTARDTCTRYVVKV